MGLIWVKGADLRNDLALFDMKREYGEISESSLRVNATTELEAFIVKHQIKIRHLRPQMAFNTIQISK